jgi:hypothetical protein
MGCESQGRVIESLMRDDERARVTATARRANVTYAPSRSRSTREAALGEVGIFRLDFAVEVARAEDQRDEDGFEGDKGCEKEEDFHDSFGLSRAAI